MGDSEWDVIEPESENEADDSEWDILAGQECDVRIISREEWGAQDAKPETTPAVNPKTGVVLNHTAVTFEPSVVIDQPEFGKLEVRQIQNYHMGPSRGWADIGYNFLIDEGGHVYEGRGWDTDGAHTKGYNQRCHGIAIIGNFSQRSPSDKALDALERLLQLGVQQGKLVPGYKLLGHCDVRPSDSPGKHFHGNWVSKHHYYSAAI